MTSNDRSGSYDASFRAMRNSIAGGQLAQLDLNEKRRSFSEGGKDSPDIEVGETLVAYDDQGPVEFDEKKELKRGLKQRHIQMIALAGTIGTGLFLSSGKAIARSGPLGALLGYSIVGALCAGVVMSIAELSALVPLSGGIIRHAEYFVDPALSFANGYNQVYSCMVSIPAELVAACVLVEFWKTINNAVWITVFGLIVIASNLFFVRIYGEMEFTFAMLKIMLVVGINIMALVITCGGSPTGQTIGFRYWKSPNGPFVQYLAIPGALGQFAGFWTTFNNAIYAFSGIENISLAAAETQNPRRAIPQAAKRIFIRVGVFYILTIFMVGLVVRSGNPQLLKNTGTARSPFVIAATAAKIKVVPSIINAVVISSAFSSANSSMLAGSRILYGLCKDGNGPKIFTRVSKFGIPVYAVGWFGLFICLGYMTLSSGAATVFNWLQDLVSVATLFNWSTICLVYLRFYYGMKKQGIQRSELPWYGPLQPYLAWFSLVMFVILFIFGGYTTFIHHHWSDEVFVSSYINLPIFAMLYFGYKLIRKTSIIPLDKIPIREFIQIANDNPEPPEAPKSGLARFNIFW